MASVCSHYAVQTRKLVQCRHVASHNLHQDEQVDEDERINQGQSANEEMDEWERREGPRFFKAVNAAMQQVSC